MPDACRSSRLVMGAWMSQLIRRARTRTLKMGSLPLNSLPIHASGGWRRDDNGDGSETGLVHPEIGVAGISGDLFL
jgi:hypothetical protein